MAAKLGTVFVELSLDDKVYKQKLSETLTSTTATAKGIETSWKALGVKSDAMFEAQVRAAQNAYTLIAAASGKASQEAIRAQEAAANKIKRINEQQYGHHNTLLENLKKNWIAASVAIAAAAVVARQAWSMVKEGAEFDEQRTILDNLARKYKMTADSIVASMRYASAGQIANADLINIALGGIAKGLKPEQLINLANAAKILGDTVGQNATVALKELSEALESGRARALKGYAGTTIDLTAAFGDLEKKMTAVEKANAMYSLIMIHATKLQKEQTGAVDEAADKIERLEARYKNMTTTLAQWTKTAALFLWEVMNAGEPTGDEEKAIIERLNKTKAGSGQTKTDPLKQYQNEIAELKKILKTRDDLDKAGKKSDSEREAALKRMTEATRKAAYEIESVGMSQYQKDVDRINAEAAEYFRVTKDKGKVAKFVAAETELALRKSFIVQTEDAKKIYDEQVKASEDYRKMVADEQSFSVDKHTAAMLKIIANENNKLLAAEKLMDEGKISWGEYQTYLVLATQNTTLAIQELKRQEQEEGLKLLETLEYSYKNEYEKLFEATVKSEADILEVKMKALDIYFDKVKWINEQLTKHKATESEKELDYIAEGMRASAQAFEVLSQMYKEDSEERKVLHDISMAFAVAEKAALVVKAIAAVLTQGTGDPYSAFARMAVMVGAVAALLSQVGVAFSGGGGASVAAKPPSSVFGAEAGTASESIANSLQLLEDTYTMEDTKLTNIYNELKDLNSNIMGLVTSIIRTGAISAEGMNLNLDYQKGAARKVWEAQGTLEGGVPDWISFTPLGKWVSGVLGSWGEALFGGGTSSAVTSQGIEIGNILIKNILAGIDVSAQQYATVTQTTSAGFFGNLFGGSDTTSIHTVYDTLNQNVTDMLTLVFKNIGKTLMFLAENLGTDTQKVLDYVFKTTQINLQGMTGEEMNKALQDYISNISDTAVEDLFGTMLKGYQKLNEGLLETAVRLITDKEIVLSVLEMTGQAFTGTIPQIIAFSESLIEMAGGLDKLMEAASTYFDKFFTDSEKQARLQTQLSDVMDGMGKVLPGAREGYRALVEDASLLTTEAGRKLYITLLQLAEGADAYYSYLEEIARKRQDLEIQIMELTGDAAGALAAQRVIELATLDESLRPLQQRIWALQDEAQAITDVTATIDTLKNRAQQISQFIIDMGMSVQAPVQSAAAWNTEYARQRTLAMASGASDQDISGYLAFAKQYLSYQQSYGTAGSYQKIYDAIMKDVTGLGVATNTALDIAQQQLDVLIQIRDGIGSGGVTMKNPMPPEISIADNWISGPTMPITYTKSDKQSLSNLIVQAIQNSNGGSTGGDIHVSVTIDGREIGNVVAKQTKINSDLQQSIRSLNN